jgi:glyoxalase family protein
MAATITGIHHLTAVTANARENLQFYTGTLGMRLVKKTVNQDDVSAYHLFYGDGIGSAGSDITFFDWPTGPERRGSHCVVRTGLRVAEAALEWWHDRLKALGVSCGEPVERDGRPILELEDGEGQRLALIADGGDGEAHPWDRSPVPRAHQIRGLGPIMMSVPRPERTVRVLTEVMGMRLARSYRAPASVEPHATVDVMVFEMGEGGPASELHVMVEPDAPFAQAGAGGVHHVAFRTPDRAHLTAWKQLLDAHGVRNSGEVERFYFRSLYFREPNGVLFEIATDGPGFAADEPIETLGQTLSLPPFLEARRAEIEAGLQPL